MSFSEEYLEENKVYSQEDDEENDPKSKEIAVELLSQLGCVLKEPLHMQPERYCEGDFWMCNSKGEPLLFEVERKKGWLYSGKWEGFPDLQVAGRKHKNGSAIFIMFNFWWDTAAITGMKTVKDANRKRVPNKCVPSGKEKFYKVNLEHFIFFTKEDNKWVQVDKDGNKIK